MVSFSRYLIISLFLVGSGYIAYRYYTKQQEQALVPEVSCQKDSDCVIGFQPSTCCACPEPIAATQVGMNGWEEYYGEKKYPMVEKCGNIQCFPCEHRELLFAFKIDVYGMFQL